MERNVEILAPAGTFDIMKAAIYAGADAVYVGGDRFGARAFAGNFTKDELIAAIDFVHVHGRKLYLTVNTLLKDQEIEELYEYLNPFYEQGLDAVIVQDLGVLSFVRENFPDLPIHASTQMTVTNALSALNLERLGVERIVLARELSLAEIKEISQKTTLEIECFVHGALCYGYSGQCLMSSMIGGRSGNRGTCAQPCRLPYQTEFTKRDIDILSLRDLCTIDMIPELLSHGITSFKIEGRMKQEDYVRTVVSMYRKYVDQYLLGRQKSFRVNKQEHKNLLSAYRRRGYTKGYYTQHNGRELLSLERPETEKEQRATEILEQFKEKINGELILLPERHATLKIMYGNIELTTKGELVQHAKKQPMDKERIEKQLRKTGNTPFSFEQVFIQMKEPVFLSMQGLNELRRTALQALIEELLKPYKRSPVCKPSAKTIKKTDNQEPLVSVLVETKEQLAQIKEYSFIDRVYIEDSGILKPDILKLWMSELEAVKSTGKQVYLAMARIFRNHAKQYYDECLSKEAVTLFDGMLIRNMESNVYLQNKKCSLPIITDANVYVWNQYAKEFWKQENIKELTAPVELNQKELSRLDISEMEYIIYGYQPVMVSAGCVRKAEGTCDKNQVVSYLSDRYRKKFAVKNYCQYCYNVIYNSVPLCLLDMRKELKQLNPSSVRLEFYQERSKEVKIIMDTFQNIWIQNLECEMPNREITKGHFKRGVK